MLLSGVPAGMAELCGNLAVTLLQHSVGALALSASEHRSSAQRLEIDPQSREGKGDLPGTAATRKVSCPCVGEVTVAQKTLMDLFPFYLRC